MIITDEKFPVSMSMLERANMTRGEQIGVPVDPKDPSKGLRWKTLFVDIEDADFDALEEYFLLKSKK